MTNLTLLEAAHEYANSFANKKEPILPCEIEDAYCDGYNAALEYINSLIDRKNETLNDEKLSTKIQTSDINSILEFVDYINEQSDFSSILEDKIREDELKKMIREELNKMLKNIFTLG